MPVPFHLCDELLSLLYCLTLGSNPSTCFLYWVVQILIVHFFPSDSQSQHGSKRSQCHWRILTTTSSCVLLTHRRWSYITVSEDCHNLPPSSFVLPSNCCNGLIIMRKATLVVDFCDVQSTNLLKSFLVCYMSPFACSWCCYVQIQWPKRPMDVLN